jgi:ribosomal protein L6P/L9E
MIGYRNVYLPIFFNFLCLKAKNDKTTCIYIYNNNIIMKLRILTKRLYLNKNTNHIKILFINNYNGENNNYIDKKINRILKELYIHFYIKIKFKGKGFKIIIKRKKRRIKFFFGASHLKIISLKKVRLKKLTKYKFYIKCNSIQILKKISNKILNIRQLNPYTLRGLRLSKMPIIKRKGKKGV